jgi:hypothetical protein
MAACRVLTHCSLYGLERFVLDMHKGYPSHGCTVNTLKTQVNFDMSVDGKQLNNVNHRPSTAKHHRHPKSPSPTGAAHVSHRTPSQLAVLTN